MLSSVLLKISKINNFNIPEGKAGCKHCDKRFATVTTLGISLNNFAFVENT